MMRAGIVIVVGWALFGALGCAEEEALWQQGEVSACGGFHASPQLEGVRAERTAPTGYCDAEVLEWRYDADTEELLLTNARVILNCCGVHTVSIRELTERSYRLVERDEPDPESSRCRCLCSYDFRLRVKPIEGGTITLTLVREVTDSALTSKVIWEGPLGLGLGSGVIVIDESAAAGACQE